MDRDRASFMRTLESLEKAFGRAAVPLAIPLGEEKGFVGLTDLLTEKADVYSDDLSGKYQAVEVPAEYRASEKELRDKLVEMVAEGNEALMEEFFEKGTLPQEDLVKGLRQAVVGARLFPVLPVSSGRNIGVQPLLDAIVDLLPSPAERGEVAGTDPVTKKETTRRPAADAPFSAFVFKTVADPHAGRISLFRVYSGVFKSDSTVHNASRDVAERVGNLELLEGKNQTPVPEIQAGDLGAVAKLKETQTGDTLCDKAHPIVYPPLVFPEPATTFAIEPKTRGDEDKISAALHRLMEEDPVLRLSRDAQTHEMLLSGIGQLHIEVVVGKLKKRYKVEVNLRKPKIPYRETIKGAAEGHGRHKKQTGGHGQFGDCKIRMKPLPRGSDFQFVDDIFGGSIPKNFIPAVEKGIQEARTRGFVAGLPDGGLPGRALRRAVPRRRLLRDVLQDRGLARLQGRGGQVPSHAPRAGDEGGDRGARGVRGLGDGRPLEPARAAPGHGAQGQPAGGEGRGAAVGDALLRRRAHVDDGGSGLLPHGDGALRGGARPPPGEDHRRGEGGARRREGSGVTWGS